MITKELINKINALSHKKKTIGLTDKEAVEQKELYKFYLAGIRAQVKSTLDNVKVVNDKD